MAKKLDIRPASRASGERSKTSEKGRSKRRLPYLDLKRIISQISIKRMATEGVAWP